MSPSECKCTGARFAFRDISLLLIVHCNWSWILVNGCMDSCMYFISCILIFVVFACIHCLWTELCLVTSAWSYDRALLWWPSMPSTSQFKFPFPLCHFSLTHVRVVPNRQICGTGTSSRTAFNSKVSAWPGVVSPPVCTWLFGTHAGHGSSKKKTPLASRWQENILQSSINRDDGYYFSCNPRVPLSSECQGISRTQLPQRFYLWGCSSLDCWRAYRPHPAGAVWTRGIWSWLTLFQYRRTLLGN